MLCLFIILDLQTLIISVCSNQLQNQRRDKMRKLSLFLASILLSTILFPLSTFANPEIDFGEEFVSDDETNQYFGVEFDSIDEMNQYFDNTGNLIIDEQDPSDSNDERNSSSLASTKPSSQNKNTNNNRNNKNQIIKEFQRGAKEINKGRPPITYQYGGNQRPTKNRNGILDCSSFTQYVYDKYFDIKLPRTTYQQFDKGKKVSVNKLKAGDLVFKNGRGHVGVYLGKGKVLHNSTSKGKPVIVSLKEFNPQEAVRYKIKANQNNSKATPKKTTKDTNTKNKKVNKENRTKTKKKNNDNPSEETQEITIINSDLGLN